MSTGQRPDPQRKKKPAPHATYFEVKNGGKEAAYKAGALHGVYGHRTHAHQPCCFTITEGKLSCTYCSDGLEPVWRGYVPLWDRDWVLRYVLIGEEMYPSVEQILWKEQVVVVRAKAAKSPLIVRSERTFVRNLPDAAPHNVEVKMLDVCLSLWKCERLTRWYEEKAAFSATTEVEPTKSVHATNRIVAAEVRKNRDKLLCEAVDEWAAEGRGNPPLRGPAVPHQNGKPPKKG